MISLFIEENEKIELEFFIAKDVNDMLYCEMKESDLKDLLGADTVVEKHKVVFKKPNFGDTVTLYKDMLTMKVDIEQNMGMELNPLESRYKKIILLLKEWDLKDGSVTEEDIKKLHPIIAHFLGNYIDMELGGILG